MNRRIVTAIAPIIAAAALTACTPDDPTDEPGPAISVSEDAVPGQGAERQEP